MARPKSKDTEAYKKRQEIFWNNLFVFLLGLVQEKIGRPRNPLKDINFLARILHKDRLIATRWRDKITLPGSNSAYMEIIYRLLIYFNIPQFPLEGYHLYTIDCQAKFDKDIREAINLPKTVSDDILILREPLNYLVPKKLQSIIDDPLEQRLLNITAEEISVLSRIRFPEEFRTSSALYKTLLAYYRGL